MSRPSSGFTLIEMLLVVSILALLAGILVPSLDDSSSYARDAIRIADLRRVKAALATYKARFGRYPATGDDWWGEAPDFGSHGYGPAGYIPGLVPGYMKALPADPLRSSTTSSSLGYVYRSDGVDYKLLAWQSPEDPSSSSTFADPADPSSWSIHTPGARNWIP